MMLMRLYFITFWYLPTGRDYDIVSAWQQYFRSIQKLHLRHAWASGDAQYFERRLNGQ